MTTTRLKIGTRGSPLALVQAESVAAPLRALGRDVEIVPVRTEGDRRLEVQLAAIGGKGLFVREIEEMLLAGTLDCAVHSLKDLPAETPTGLALAAFPEREDPRDVLVTREPRRFEDLRPGARLGTGSPRRRALALALRSDLVVEPVRGNVGTRLAKLESAGLDGVLLAAAGLKRLGMAPPHVQALDPDAFVPAVGQGVLAVETRADDRDVLAVLSRLDHAATRACALAERACLGRLGASCSSPVAAHAVLEGASLRITALVASDDGRKVLRATLAGAADDAERLGRRAADSLLEQGAATVAPLRPVT
jgi:hydroxymethylbilane synthase